MVEVPSMVRRAAPFLAGAGGFLAVQRTEVGQSLSTAAKEIPGRKWTLGIAFALLGWWVMSMGGFVAKMAGAFLMGMAVATILAAAGIAVPLPF